jgi:hypothetical protein
MQEKTAFSTSTQGIKSFSRLLAGGGGPLPVFETMSLVNKRIVLFYAGQLEVVSSSQPESQGRFSLVDHWIPGLARNSSY